MVRQHAERVRYFGNVRLGTDVTLEELSELYGVGGGGVILCTGAQGGDRALGVPGETEHVNSARELVAWYNGHPRYARRAHWPSGSGDAIVIGNGNVAIDVARMLMRSAAELQRTDCSDAAVAARSGTGQLDRQRVARAGDLRPAAGVVLHDMGEWDAERTSRSQRRCWEILRQTRAPTAGESAHEFGQLHLRFQLSPVAVERVGEVVRVECAQNQLVRTADGNVRAVSRQPAQRVCLEAAPGAVFRSIGYQAQAVPGLPFDAARNLIPNERGSVEGAATAIYVAGWLKRGPQGIIGTNGPDAQETVERLAADASEKWEGGSVEPENAESPLACLLQQRQVPYVDWHGWLRIDAEERRRGRAQNRPRVKLLSVEEMLAVAHGSVGESSWECQQGEERTLPGPQCFLVEVGGSAQAAVSHLGGSAVLFGEGGGGRRSVDGCRSGYGLFGADSLSLSSVDRLARISVLFSSDKLLQLASALPSTPGSCMDRWLSRPLETSSRRSPAPAGVTLLGVSRRLKSPPLFGGSNRAYAHSPPPPSLLPCRNFHVGRFVTTLIYPEQWSAAAGHRVWHLEGRAGHRGRGGADGTARRLPPHRLCRRLPRLVSGALAVRLALHRSAHPRGQLAPVAQGRHAGVRPRRLAARHLAGDGVAGGCRPGAQHRRQQLRPGRAARPDELRAHPTRGEPDRVLPVARPARTQGGGGTARSAHRGVRTAGLGCLSGAAASGGAGDRHSPSGDRSAGMPGVEPATRLHGAAQVGAARPHRPEFRGAPAAAGRSEMQQLDALDRALVACDMSGGRGGARSRNLHIVKETLVGNVSAGGRLREVRWRRALAAVVPRPADRHRGTDAGNAGDRDHRGTVARRPEHRRERGLRVSGARAVRAAAGRRNDPSGHGIYSTRRIAVAHPPRLAVARSGRPAHQQRAEATGHRPAHVRRAAAGATGMAAAGRRGRAEPPGRRARASARQ
eukprot:ctg_336.g181